MSCYKYRNKLGAITEHNKKHWSKGHMKKDTLPQICLSECICEVLTEPNLCLPPSPSPAKERLWFVMILRMKVINTDLGLVCTNLYVISSLVLPQAMTLLLRILFYWEDMKLLLNILSRLPRWSEIRPASLQRPCSFCCILFGGWIVNFLKKFITIFIISFCHILINISLCNLFKKWCLVILPILEKSYVF